jgi:hypothetical protein
MYYRDLCLDVAVIMMPLVISDSDNYDGIPECRVRDMKNRRRFGLSVANQPTMSATAPLSLSSKIKLNNGISMPRIHLGVYMTSGRETEAAVRWALVAGYRGVDSAEWYANEREVGSAIEAFLGSSKNTQGLIYGSQRS